jgi:hypothetical protein
MKLFIPVCHGQQQRAIQAGVRLFGRVDTRLLDGPGKPGHDTFR